MPDPAAAPKAVGRIRAVALPNEHGGWSLSLEPAILGLLVAPSWSGVMLSLVGLLAFVTRTPLKLALVDRWRHRRLERTGLAERIALAEMVLLGCLLGLAFAFTPHSGWWWPIALATPLFVIELWYDMHSRGRRLVALLSGPLGVGALAASVVLVGGGSTLLALGAWLAISIRSIAAIFFVRFQLARSRGQDRASELQTGLVQALVAGIALVAWLEGPLTNSSSLLPWPVAALVMAIVGIHLVLSRRPVPPPKVVGLQQLVFGVVFVIAAGLAFSI